LNSPKRYRNIQVIREWLCKKINGKHQNHLYNSSLCPNNETLAMRLITLTLLSFLCSASIYSQYATPGTGVHWTLDSLVLYSGGAVLGAGQSFTLTQSLEVAAGDSLFILSNSDLAIASEVQVTISGFIETGSDLGPIIHSVDDENPYQGFRIEEGATAIFVNTDFPDGGGFKLISGEVFFSNCSISNQANISTSSAAIECFTGSPSISNCTITFNDGAAISSPANISCWPQIAGNFIFGNNTLNSNRPQINLGPSGEGNTILIQFNTVSGNDFLNQVGGIAVANLVGGISNVLIQGNSIDGNRYGIAILGNGITAEISDNIIVNNTTQGDPDLGGSGINLNGNNSSSAIVSNNTISQNLWGITVQGTFLVDMGNLDFAANSPGNNSFSVNGNGGQIYALYNNSPNPISAVNNCWITGQESTEAQIEDVIFHDTDDSSLGLVNYATEICGSVGLEEDFYSQFKVFPNPVNDMLRWENPTAVKLDAIRIYSLLGNLVRIHTNLSPQGIDLSYLNEGLYMIELQAVSGVYRTTLIKD
jgi:hypothetical protein